MRDNYPPGMNSLQEDLKHPCPNCRAKLHQDELHKCPKCLEFLVCPLCEYCMECQLLVPDMDEDDLYLEEEE